MPQIDDLGRESFRRFLKQDVARSDIVVVKAGIPAQVHQAAQDGDGHGPRFRRGKATSFVQIFRQERSLEKLHYQIGIRPSLHGDRPVADIRNDIPVIDTAAVDDFLHLALHIPGCRHSLRIEKFQEATTACRVGDHVTVVMQSLFDETLDPERSDLRIVIQADHKP